MDDLELEAIFGQLDDDRPVPADVSSRIRQRVAEQLDSSTHSGAVVNQIDPTALVGVSELRDSTVSARSRRNLILAVAAAAVAALVTLGVVRTDARDSLETAPPAEAGVELPDEEIEEAVDGCTGPSPEVNLRLVQTSFLAAAEISELRTSTAAVTTYLTTVGVSNRELSEWRSLSASTAQADLLARSGDMTSAREVVRSAQLDFNEIRRTARAEASIRCANWLADA